MPSKIRMAIPFYAFPAGIRRQPLVQMASIEPRMYAIISVGSILELLYHNNLPVVNLIEISGPVYVMYSFSEA